MENIKRVILRHSMRMNMKIYPFLLACLLGLVADAQQTLEVKGKFPDIYVLYVSTGTETLQTVSNQFGFSVAKLSTFNAVNINPAAVMPGVRPLKYHLVPIIYCSKPAKTVPR